MARSRTRLTLSTPAIYTVLLSYFVVTVFPMVWMFYTSLKPSRDIFMDPFALPSWSELAWSNFTRAWTAGHIGDYFLNSVLITVATVILTLVVASMAAYALARFVFPGAKPLLFFFLAGLMVPTQLSVVPLFFELKALGMLNSRTWLVVVYVASGMPFAIFVLTGYLKTLPAAMHESALIDGCGEFRAFWNVMLPLSKPGLITVGIFAFLGTWNEYFLAFMFLSGRESEAIRTLPLGLANITIVSQYRTDWGMTFAGLVIVTIPALIAYSVMQRHLTKGITLGAVKG